ncbi:hypothetical protein ACFQFH_15800 [Halobaculum halobium]|uniref:hypothetical protein n=1 Tax=Halobaculum halobium TaxID=3032281 RepID=UPI00360DAAA2
MVVRVLGVDLLVQLSEGSAVVAADTCSGSLQGWRVIETRTATPHIISENKVLNTTTKHEP